MDKLSPRAVEELAKVTLPGEAFSKELALRANLRLIHNPADFSKKMIHLSELQDYVDQGWDLMVESPQ